MGVGIDLCITYVCAVKEKKIKKSKKKKKEKKEMYTAKEEKNM